MPKKNRSMRDFESAVEKQLREAEARGEFANLPGLGKPIPGLDKPHDELWWVKSLVRREGVDLLPDSLALRRDVENALQRVARAPDEATVRRLVREVNEHIAAANRTITSGPPSNVAPLDVEGVLRRWRAPAAD